MRRGGLCWSRVELCGGCCTLAWTLLRVTLAAGEVGWCSCAGHVGLGCGRLSGSCMAGVRGQRWVGAPRPWSPPPTFSRPLPLVTGQAGVIPLLGHVPHEERKVFPPTHTCSRPRPRQVTALGRCMTAPHHLALVSRMWPRLLSRIPVVFPRAIVCEHHLLPNSFPMNTFLICYIFHFMF